MALVNPAPWLQNSGNTNTAQLLRLATGHVKGPTAGSPSTLSGKSGVLPRPGNNNFAVTQNGGGDMSVNVAAGIAHVRGTESGSQGGYWIVNDATVNKTFTAAHATNNRTDSVYVTIKDQFYSGGVNTSELNVAAGDPSFPTTPPTLPANSFEIARVTVRAATTNILTADISDRRSWIAAPGGITLARSFESTDPGILDGDLSFINPTGMRVWDSAASVWRAYPMFVGSLTDITANATPKTDQHVLLTGDNHWYRWTGSAWAFAPMPQGLVRVGRRSTNSTGTTSIVGVERIDDEPMLGGRAHLVRVTGIHCFSTVANDRALVEVRATTDGSTPTTSSPVLPGGQCYQLCATGGNSVDGGIIECNVEPAPFSNITLSVLLTVSRASGSGTVAMFADSTHTIEVKIYDEGIAAGDTGTDI